MIVIDIGANKGELSSFLLETIDHVMVYAVEPNFLLCSKSLNQISLNHPKDFIYLPIALSRTNGRAKLFAPQVLDGQVGSLLQVNTSGVWHPEVSKNLSNNETSQFIDIETWTVAKLIESQKLRKIDFIKIDTQGTDLDILEDFLSICDVKVAAVEVEVNPDQALSHYSDSHNDISRMFEILDRYGYKVMRMFPVSSDCQEFNVFIAKSSSDFLLMNELLNFSSMPVFSRYWEVLGIGDRKIGVSKLQKSILKKIFSALMHPRQSYKSMLIKLSS